MKLIFSPTVYLVGKQVVDEEELGRFLADHEVSGWETDTEVAGEKLVEVAGRSCYMSFARPRPGGNKAYIDHILEVQHGSVCEHAVWNLVVVGVSRSLSHELVRHRIGISPSQLSQRYVDESVAEYVVPPDLQEEVALARALMTAEKYESAVDFLRYSSRSGTGGFRPKEEIGLRWLESVELSHRAYERLADYLSGKAWKSAYEAYLDRVNDGRDQEPMSFEVFKQSQALEARDKTAARKFARQAARSVLPNATETKLFLTMNARAARHFIELRASRHADPEIRILAHAVWKVLVGAAPNLFSDYEEVRLPDGTFELTTRNRKV